MNWIRRSAAGLAALAVFVALAGCDSGPGTGTVKGTVTVGGKPLAKGTITFLPEQGNRDPYSCQVVNGQYEIPGITAGPAKVYLMPPLGDGEAVAMDKGDLTKPATKPSSSSSVPEKYQNPETSGLSTTINKGGVTTYDPQLNP